MNPEVKTLWLEALRSGKYQQGRRSLRSRGQLTLDHEPDKFCCLGVLCDLYVQTHPEDKIGWGQRDYRTSFLNIDEGETTTSAYVSYPPAKVRDWAGLKSSDPTVMIYETDEDGYAIKPEHKLSQLNDSFKSFQYIANVIEKQL